MKQLEMNTHPKKTTHKLKELNPGDSFLHKVASGDLVCIVSAEERDMNNQIPCIILSTGDTTWLDPKQKVWNRKQYEFVRIFLLE